VRDEAMKGARILIVDDEAANVRLLERLLERGGFTNLKGTTDSRQTMPLFVEFQPDLILLDLLMPHKDGFQILEDLKPLIPDGAYLPVLVLTADVSGETKRKALAAGAKDFVIKPFDATEILLRIGNLLETRFLYLEIQGQNEQLETKVRERTQQLLQAEKLATLGELIAGIAHELNNPLSAMVGHAQLLGMSQKDPAVAARVGRILEAAQRATRVVRNFLTFARRHRPEKVAVQVNEIITKTLELLAYQFRVSNIEVQAALAQDLPATAADPHQIGQVFLNLFNNAAQAMAKAHGQGTLRVTSAVSPDGGWISVIVADDGPGISRENLPRLFEPFFTTKPPGEGTGLGLPLARGIVTEHGGSITIESEPGRGATFVVTLPVAAAVAASPETAPLLGPPSGLRILVVDDEAPLREVMGDALAERGNQVEVAASGHEALEIIGRAPLDLLVLDVRMPEMSGPDLWTKVKETNPTLARRTVFCTGDVATADVRAFLETTGCPVLTKPFDLAQYFDAVARAARC